MIRPIEGASLQVSTPALVVGGVWAAAGEAHAAARTISAGAVRCLSVTKLSAFWTYSGGAGISAWYPTAITPHFLVSEFVTNSRSNLIVAQFLLEPDKTEIQDRDGIDEGLGLELRVAVFDAGEPVVRDGVIKTASDRPPPARAVAAD